MRKFVRRHRAGVAAATIATLSLVSGLGVAVWQAKAARARPAGPRRPGFLQNVFLLSDPDRAEGEKLTARDLLDRGAARVEAELADQPLLHAEMQSLLGTVYQQLSLYPQAKGLFEKALATREPLLPEADPQLAESYRRLVRSSTARRSTPRPAAISIAPWPFTTQRRSLVGRPRARERVWRTWRAPRATSKRPAPWASAW